MGLDKKRIIVAVALFVLAVSVPVTLSLLQQRQDNRSKASASTTLSFSPSTITKPVGQTIAIDVMINPGTNMVSYVKFEAKFDPTVLQIDNLTPFVPNTTAFPGVQNSVITSNSLKAEVSIGSDLTKAIKTPVKVGTLYFKAINPTTTLSQITFGNITQVLSINPADKPTENVLSNSVPATVVVNSSSTTPTTTSATSTPAPTTPNTTATPSPTAITTSVPTITPSVAPTNPIGGGPSATPSPTNTATTTPGPSTTVAPTTTGTVSPTQTPTATIVPTVTGPGIMVNLNLILHSIGVGGDNVNPTAHSFSNKAPIHASRSAIVTLHNASDIVIGAGSGIVYYSSASGSFVGTVKLPLIGSGYYLMRVRTDNHLTRRIPGIINLTSQTITVPALQYIAGDANNDNKLNILDYNVLIDCFGPNNAVNCNDNKKLATDFNDDGQVNQVDYNLFLRELSQSFGD